MLPKRNFISTCNTLIFFWVPDKHESIFQIFYLISIFNINPDIFIIGQNKFGINSMSQLFKHWIQFKKIDYKKKCSLYQGKIINTPIFSLKNFFKRYTILNITIISLPGVFGYKGIDQGSMLMINTFNKTVKGKVLDIGSGSGILSAYLKKKFEKIQINLVDNSSTALICSKLTLRVNNITGKVYYSNIFSHISEKFNLIISNPPTHYGNIKNLNIINHIVENSRNFLYKNGELRIVLHANISGKKILTKFFGNFNILQTYKHFSVYQAIFKKK